MITFISKGLVPFILLFVWPSHAFLIFAQQDSSSRKPINLPYEEVLQSLAEQGENPEDADLDLSTALLESWRRRPLNINDPDHPDLQDFLLLDPALLEALRQYIRSHGPLISLYELQVVPGFDTDLIRRISPFIQLRPELDRFTIGLREQFLSSQDQWLIRLSRNLETLADSGASKTRFAGSPFALLFRFRHFYDNRLSIGFLGEKDPGESFFRKDNKAGFDHYSFHAGIRQVGRIIEELVVGDYTVSLGQGLLMHAGMGGRKGAFVTGIRKPDRVFKPYTAAGEFNYFRGLCALLKPKPHLQLAVFYSNRQKDANAGSASVEGLEVVTGFLESGFHRSPAELEDERRVNEQMAGGSIRRGWRAGHLAINLVSSRYDKFFKRKESAYTAFAFSGHRLTQASLDWGIKFRNFNWFSEAAFSSPAGTAFVSGLQTSLDKRLDLALLYRTYDKKYHSFYANAFGEFADPVNEKGFYAGLQFAPASKWKINAYWDFWIRPWYSYQADGPSAGNEQLVRIQYAVRYKMDTYLQFRYRLGEENGKEPSVLTPLVERRQTQIRIHLNLFHGNGLETRSRIEFNKNKRSGAKASTGFLAFQDLLYQPVQSWFSGSARFCFFSTRDYESRIYAYENDLLYNYSVPAFSGKGFRVYLNQRWALSKQLVLEGRWACTFKLKSSVEDLDSFENEGNKTMTLKFQCRWQFGI
jgi:hypothetical protein